MSKLTNHLGMDVGLAVRKSEALITTTRIVECRYGSALSTTHQREPYDPKVHT